MCSKLVYMSLPMMGLELLVLLLRLLLQAVSMLI